MSVQTPVNPWTWSQGFGYEQATLVEVSRLALPVLLVEMEATAYQ
jgi:hypothetical protein